MAKAGFFLTIIITVSLALGISPSFAAQNEAIISDLTALDIRYMKEQREEINDIARRSFGGRITGKKDQDLQILQRILDQNLVRPVQTKQLQAMGMVLGDLLAQDLDMHWVLYQDSVGRSRALRYRDTQEYLFPVTMISRRREVDNRTSVQEIYRRAYDIIDTRRPKLPFQ